jgi:hypothetical protein
MSDNYFNQNSLFIGRVLGINPANYTISIRPQAGRMGFDNVRVIAPNTAYINGRFRGFSWMPHPGDWVVCGYLEGYPDLPVCFGAIYNFTNTRPPEAATEIDNNGVNQYQFYDYVIQHETGSFIRIRNLNQPLFNSTSGSWVEPSTNLTQLNITQQLSDNINVNEIVLEETAVGNSTVTISHNSGATIKIDKDGNIILIPTDGKTIYIGDSTGTKKIVLDGDSTSGHSHTYTWTGSPGSGTTGSSTDTIVASSTKSEAK